MTETKVAQAEDQAFVCKMCDQTISSTGVGTCTCPHCGHSGEDWIEPLSEELEDEQKQESR